MAVAAVDPQPADVMLMAERHRLLALDPLIVAYGERTMPPITHSTKPTTKTAPKIVTRERVLALRWKI